MGGEVIEEYYETLWRSERWGSDRPNRDEADRLRAIRSLVAGVRLSPHGERPRILDLGCGRGWLSAQLADLGDVTGLDPLDASIVRARELFPDLNWITGTTSDLIEAGEPAFDLIVSSEVVEHVPDAEKSRFLADVYRLTVPGGYVVLTTPRGELWPAWLEREGNLQPVEDWLTESALRRLCSDSGFEIVDRDRAHVLRRPFTWQGWLLKYVLNRRFVRDLPLAWVRGRLEFVERFYQVLLIRRPPPTTPGA